MTKKKENVIGFDFQGWPIYKMTLGEILVSLGAQVVSTESGHSFLAIENTNPILDAFPRILEDDGMSYGVNAQFITEASDDIYLDEDMRSPVFNMFVDVPRPDEIAEFRKGKFESKE